MSIQLNSKGCGKGNIISGDVGIDGYIPSKETLLHMLKAYGDPQYGYLLSLGLENWSIVSFNPSQNQACIIYKNPTTGLEVPTIVTLPNPNIPFTRSAGEVHFIDADGIETILHPSVAFPPGNGECCHRPRGAPPSSRFG